MTQKIISMIYYGVSTNEIMKQLNITKEEFIFYLKKIKEMGYTLIKKEIKGEKKYFFRYGYDEKIHCINNEYEPEIETEKFRAVVISDNHLGHKRDRIDLIDNVFEYAAANSIKYIINTGDFINGVTYSDDIINRGQSNLEQIDYAMIKYPYDKNIKTILLLGNHDAAPLYEEGIDIRKIIENKRKDIICLGYRFAKILLNSESIALYHPFYIGDTKQYENDIKSLYNYTNLPKIAFLGHTHNIYRNNKLDFPMVMVPSIYDNNSKKPTGAWDFECSLKNSMIDEISLKKLSVDPKVVTKKTYYNKIKKM
ncbi:MAG TPA: hypothetical protein GX747_02015 [Tenericutes bacterium]|nr:hypothetical protein [Mycoplasmatota bacterium]